MDKVVSPKPMALSPIGIRGDEPMAYSMETGVIGIREAYLRGMITLKKARKIYKDPDNYQFDEKILAWSRENQAEKPDD